MRCLYLLNIMIKNAALGVDLERSSSCLSDLEFLEHYSVTYIVKLFRDNKEDKVTALLQSRSLAVEHVLEYYGLDNVASVTELMSSV